MRLLSYFEPNFINVGKTIALIKTHKTQIEPNALFSPGQCVCTNLPRDKKKCCACDTTHLESGACMFPLRLVELVFPAKVNPGKFKIYPVSIPSSLHHSYLCSILKLIEFNRKSS